MPTLVTGGSKGLGKAMARGFAEAGADVFISSRNAEELQAAAAEIGEGARLALEAFANAPAGDQETAAALAQFEWEAEGVYLAFDKPKEKQLGLADSTVRFFDHVPGLRLLG
jgi:NAD(P)-dependent dehydrogenase (short-subunit alcohol dehydrogenase family)